MLKPVEAPQDVEQGQWSLAEPGARRSLTLLALGAIVGLGIAGFGLFTAKGTASHTAPPEAVALINQQPILVSDYATQLQSEFGIPISRSTEAQRRKVLNDMINEELMVQRGQEMNLAGSDPEVRAALVAGVELQNSANVIAKQPTPVEMQTYYDQHKDRYRTQGLIHGFGFAAGLREMKLPTDKLAELLVGFNLGVEVGQVSVVLCVLGLAALLVKLKLAPPRRLVVDLASAALVGIGLYWFLGRAYV